MASTIAWLIGKRGIILVVVVTVAFVAGAFGSFSVASVFGVETPSHTKGLWDGPHYARQGNARCMRPADPASPSQLERLLSLALAGRARSRGLRVVLREPGSRRCSGRVKSRAG
jgi:hypothetical protein